jgi:translation initiation factor IF-2
MGHVDHGKTTLLDAIRKTKIAEQEIGGITQSIGAYTVELEKGVITFIDTPGHEAFTEMRARGAKVADIAVLVVAADEGVKPQTEEAISHARAAGVPIVVAINKIDKEGANPHLVKNQLAQLGLIPDDWGGDTLFAEISAKKRIGIDDLLEKILIQAELLNLKANPDRPAEGVIIESSIDKGLGNIATVIVQRGTLRKGDVFVAGHTFGRVRNIFSDKGKIIKELLPGFPGRIVISSEEIPLAGDKLYVVKDEETAKKIVEERKKREVKRGSIALEEIYDKLMQSEDKVTLPLILKANSKGALDALEKEIAEIKVPQLEIRIIHKGIGIISQSDINLASASKGIVIGYSVGIEKQAQNLAKMQGVQVRLYKIIYEIVDDIKKAVKGMLKPKEKEVIVGTARILKIFKLSVGKVLGCVIEKGKVQLGLNARIKRNGDIISEGKIISLKKFKDSVVEVKEGEECGILIEGLQDAREQDLLECYNIIKEEIKID